MVGRTDKDRRKAAKEEQAKANRVAALDNADANYANEYNEARLIIGTKTGTSKADRTTAAAAAAASLTSAEKRQRVYVSRESGNSRSEEVDNNTVKRVAKPKKWELRPKKA
jgi:hypothetical protein